VELAKSNDLVGHRLTRAPTRQDTSNHMYPIRRTFLNNPSPLPETMAMSRASSREKLSNLSESQVLLGSSEISGGASSHG